MQSEIDDKRLETNRWRMKAKWCRCALSVIAALSISASAQNEGSDVCKQGYVWREAYPGDHVCTTPEERSLINTENRQAASRRSPTDRTYGTDTCKSGFVWRETRAEDHVCVMPERRARVAADNRDAPNRYLRARSMGHARVPASPFPPCM